MCAFNTVPSVACASTLTLYDTCAPTMSPSVTCALVVVPFPPSQLARCAILTLPGTLLSSHPFTVCRRRHLLLPLRKPKKDRKLPSTLKSLPCSPTLRLC